LLATCQPFATNPGQHWSYVTGQSVQTNVQNNLTTRMGGCWEITGCSFGDNAAVGTNFGCKKLPPPGGNPGPCNFNGAWAFNHANKTITSVMSGKCLEAATDGAVALHAPAMGGVRVQVSSCTGKPNQQWKWADAAGPTGPAGSERASPFAMQGGGMLSGAIESVGRPGRCVDNGMVAPPPGTTGDCAVGRALRRFWPQLPSSRT
jgi:hypothetical protein